MVAHRAIGPTRYEQRLALRMEVDSIGAAARLELLDHHAGLRVNDGNRVAVQNGGVQEPPVGAERHVANEILPRACRFGHNDKRPAGRQLPVRECKLVDGCLRAPSHVEEVPARRNRDSEPRIGHGRAADLGVRNNIDHTDRGRPVPSVQHGQVFSIRRHRHRHGQRIDWHLLARGPQPPPAIKQETALRVRANLLTRSGL